ncbi:MAG: lactate racemase domain-containing protein [Chthoniobacterales bacterium]|nr:lactate racemase domain-containing protein [Chthoniobacterales bacterium]
MPWFYVEKEEITDKELQSLTLRILDEARERMGGEFRRVLLLPPDLTRAHSGAGRITQWLYFAFPEGCDVHVIPTLGQHVPHTPEENRWMFGEIPEERIHAHDWRNGVVHLGEVPSEFVAEKTQGKAKWGIPIELNSLLMSEKWDLIVHIGHVVPHEVLGFASHNKNFFIGLGGKETICSSHLASACYGIENNLGRLVTPVRACFNWAEEKYLGHLRDVYLLVVMRRNEEGRLVHSGFYVGDDFETYLLAAKASQKQNITFFEKPVKKIVAFMQGDEFRATWVANKAVYRTRMAIEDGGELLVIAPGVCRFGEQPEVEQIVRKFGYKGTEHTMKHYKTEKILQEFAHGTAHLIHGSSEGRFTIRYAPGHLSQEEVEAVGYAYMDCKKALARYNPEKMQEGWNVLPDGEELYFIHSPSAGLWASRDRFPENNLS